MSIRVNILCKGNFVNFDRTGNTLVVIDPGEYELYSMSCFNITALFFKGTTTGASNTIWYHHAQSGYVKFIEGIEVLDCVAQKLIDDKLTIHYRPNPMRKKRHII